MVAQYPHTLQVRDLTTGQYEDYSVCRDDPNTKGSKVQGQDNIAYVFSSMVYAPKGTKKLTVGREIQVYGEFGELRLRGKVMRSTQDHFHTRIWI